MMHELSSPVLPIEEREPCFPHLPFFGASPSLVSDLARAAVFTEALAGRHLVLLLPHSPGAALPEPTVGQVGVLVEVRDMRLLPGGDTEVLLAAVARGRITGAALEGEGTPRFPIERLEETDGADDLEAERLRRRISTLTAELDPAGETTARLETPSLRDGSLSPMVYVLQYFIGRQVGVPTEKLLALETASEQARLLLEKIDAYRGEPKTPVLQGSYRPGDSVAENELGLTRVERIVSVSPEAPDAGPAYEVIGRWGKPAYVPVAEESVRLRPPMDRDEAERLLAVILSEGEDPTAPSRTDVERAVASRDVFVKAEVVWRLLRSKGPMDYRGDALFRLGEPLIAEISLALSRDRDVLYDQVMSRAVPSDFSRLFPAITGVPASRRESLEEILRTGWRFLGAATLGPTATLSAPDVAEPQQLSVVSGVWYLLGWPSIFEDKCFTEYRLVHEDALGAMQGDTMSHPEGRFDFSSSELTMASVADETIALVRSSEFRVPPPPATAADRTGFVLEAMDDSAPAAITAGRKHRHWWRTRSVAWVRVLTGW